MHPRRQPSQPRAAQARLLPIARDGEWFLYTVFFMTYVVLAVSFYFSVIEPYLATADLFATRILADTITYESICLPGDYYLDQTTLRDIGPCIALQLTSFNSGALSILNATLIVLSSLWLAKAFDRNWKQVLALILLNPITFLSIFGANKEVFGLVTFITLAIFIRNRSVFALGICLVAALFTRIPILLLVAPYCVALLTILPRSGMISRRTVRRYLLILVTMVVAVSLIAALFGKDLQYNLLGDLSQGTMDNKAVLISLALEDLSDYGLFAINFIIRIILNLYSGVQGVLYLAAGGEADYYSFGVGISSLMFIVLTPMAWRARNRVNFRADSTVWNTIVFVAGFTMFLCISPVIQHRYFYPLFVFLILCVTVPANASRAPSFTPRSGHKSETGR